MVKEVVRLVKVTNLIWLQRVEGALVTTKIMAKVPPSTLCQYLEVMIVVGRLFVLVVAAAVVFVAVAAVVIVVFGLVQVQQPVFRY